MAQPTKSPANGFVKYARKAYNPIGFQKGYNFVLFFITVGAMFGFSLARFKYLNFKGVFCNPNNQGAEGAAPGECYWYDQDLYNIGIRLHLYTCLPAMLLVCFQFVPIIRHKFRLFHRINGYLVILLVLATIPGALIVGRRAFGGVLEVQLFVGVIAIMIVTSLVLSYINIKRLQIDQHRAWMLRAWTYLAGIITMRIIMIITALIITSIGTYYQVRECAQIAYMIKDDSETLSRYPSCAAFLNGTAPNEKVAVQGNFNGEVEQIAAALGLGFGSAGWITFVIHVLGVELYLWLTPAEGERLRNVSYQRQLEAGFSHAGNSGLTVQRFGDALPWVPAAEKKLSFTDGSDSDVPKEGSASEVERV